MRFPKTGRSPAKLQTAPRELRAQDASWREGRTFSLVHHAGDELTDVRKDACLMFFAENGLSPVAFPSLRRLETSTPAHAAVADEFARALADCARSLQSGEPAPEGSAAMYGITLLSKTRTQSHWNSQNQSAKSAQTPGNHSGNGATCSAGSEPGRRHAWPGDSAKSAAISAKLRRCVFSFSRVLDSSDGSPAVQDRKEAERAAAEARGDSHARGTIRQQGSLRPRSRPPEHAAPVHAEKPGGSRRARRPMLTVSAIRGFCLGQAWYGIMGTLPARAVVGEFILESLDGLERSRVAP